MTRPLQRFRLWRIQRSLAGPKLLRAFADAYPEATFIEIGSNDGEQHDHLRPFIRSQRWKGVMVEPVPYVYERLRANYGHVPRIALENAAIADHDGRLPFYHLAEVGDDERSSVPDWYDAIGSFSLEAVLRHARHIPDIESRVVETQVPALTFESLCHKHGIDDVDLVLIDTEGHDYEILRHIDFDARRPRLVVYEHYHLAPRDRADCRARLEGFGYEAMEEGFDTWCLNSDADERVLRRWRRLRPGVPGVSVHDEPA